MELRYLGISGIHLNRRIRTILLEIGSFSLGPARMGAKYSKKAPKYMRMKGNIERREVGKERRRKRTGIDLS